MKGFKYALALFNSHHYRIDPKPNYCNVPLLYLNYPEIFEAFEKEIHCKCINKCWFSDQQKPDYNITAYKTYELKDLN